MFEKDVIEEETIDPENVVKSNSRKSIAPIHLEGVTSSRESVRETVSSPKAILSPRRLKSISAPESREKSLPKFMSLENIFSKCALKVHVKMANGIDESCQAFCKISFDQEANEYLFLKNETCCTNFSTPENSTIGTHTWDYLLNFDLEKPLKKECGGHIHFHVFKSKNKKKTRVGKPSKVQEDKSTLVATGKFALRDLMSSDKHDMILPLEPHVEGGTLTKTDILMLSTKAFCRLSLTILYLDLAQTHFKSALVENNSRMVIKYIDYGYDVNHKFERTQSPANLVAANGNLELLKHLELKGANMDKPLDNPPVDCAIKNNHQDVVAYLFRTGVSLLCTTEDGVSPLERFVSNPVLSAE